MWINIYGQEPDTAQSYEVTLHQGRKKKKKKKENDNNSYKNRKTMILQII